MSETEKTEKQAARKQFWWPSWLRCEEYSRSAIMALESEHMPFWEKARFKFHHFICYNCRRWLQQVRLLDKCCMKLDDHFQDPANNGPAFSSERRSQIQEEINKHCV